jgi:hypothetical protein
VRFTSGLCVGVGMDDSISARVRLQASRTARAITSTCSDSLPIARLTCR